VREKPIKTSLLVSATTRADRLRLDARMRALWTVILVATLWAGCSKDNGAKELVAEFEPKVEQLRKKLSTYQSELPKIAPFPIPATLEPRLSVDNTDIFDFEQLHTLGESSFWQQGVLAKTVNWMKDLKKSTPEIRELFEQGVNVRYVIAGQRTKYVRPTLSGANSYTPGLLAARVYLVDLTKEKPVAVFDIASTTPEDVAVKYKSQHHASASDNERSSNSAVDRELVMGLKHGLATQLQQALTHLGNLKIYENPTYEP
jgi:hypothetical protein